MVEKFKKLLCLLFKHKWEEQWYTILESPEYGIKREYKCTRCGKTKQKKVPLDMNEDERRDFGQSNPEYRPYIFWDEMWNSDNKDYNYNKHAESDLDIIKLNRRVYGAT